MNGSLQELYLPPLATDLGERRPSRLVAKAQGRSLVACIKQQTCSAARSQPGASTREVFSMWILLAIFAGALLAAYGFFVWRYVKQQRKKSTTVTRKMRRAF
jgi:nitrate reductase NapE component